MDNKKSLSIAFIVIVSLIVGLLAGYFVAEIFSPEKPEIQKDLKNTKKSESEKYTVPVEDLESMVLGFVNSRLVKPGVSAKLASADEMDHFYRFNLTLEKDDNVVANVSVYATKDGKYLILNLIKLPEKIEEKKKTEPKPTETPKSETRLDVENEPYLGDENAEILIVEFSDYACPYCGKFAIETLPKIFENFNVKLVFKDFPLPTHGEVAIKAHEAANCAGEQGKYWEYHDVLFSRQSEWKKNSSKFVEYAKMLGLNVEEFRACLDSGKYREEVLQDREEGIKLGVRGTPTLFVNGQKVTGALPYQDFEKILREIQTRK